MTIDYSFMTSEIIRFGLKFGNNTHDDMMDDYVPDQ